MENDELKNAIKVFNSSKTTYMSNTSSKVSEIAEEYGQIMSGDLGLSFGASASQAMAGNIDVDVAFNTSKNTSWSTTFSEEYSYFNIVAANKPVILQVDSTKLKNYLSDQFMFDLKNVHSAKAAESLFEKYGTHLLTGYTLGGIFEMTNYYATDSSSYVRQQETSFSAQVNAAISYMAFSGGADIGFSFTDTYGVMDNNSHAVNNYKCTTYGGYVFPGLTIDQAFSYYETLTDAGFMYKIWTDSINAGNNLVIVEIPQSSKLVPLWDLVPFSNEYDPDIREKLIEGYMNICEKAYKDFSNKHRDIRALDIPQEDFEIDYGFVENGYQYFYKMDGSEDYVTTYIDTYDDPSKIHDLISGSIIAMDYDEGEFSGQKVKWSFGDSIDDKYIEWIDPSTCIFKVIGENNINNVVLTATVNDNQVVYKKTFNIKKKADFKAGDGTEENPYLISSEKEFLKLSSDGYANGNYHFKLISDLDFKGIECVQIGTEAKPFNGVLDGNYFTIYNYNLNLSQAKANEKGEKYLGLIGYNDGTIKNLTLSENEGGVFEYSNIGSNQKYGKLDYLGGIAAINKSKGLIENCHLYGFNGSVRIINDGTSVSNGSVAVGGISANNEGKIKLCSVKDSFLFSKGREGYISAYCGGIAAKCNNSTSESAIEMCLVNHTNIFVHAGENGVTTSSNAYGGAVCSHLLKGEISYCTVVDLYNTGSDAPFEGEARLRGIVYGKATATGINLYLGGIAAKADDGTKIFSCVTKNVSSIIGETQSPSIKYNNYFGMLVGKCDNDNIIEKCIVEEAYKAENQSEKQFIANNKSENTNNELDIEIYNLITVEKVQNSTDTEKWEESSAPAKDGKTYPVPVFDVIQELSIVTTNTKIEFLKGEEFKTGNIIINALHKNGDLIGLDSFIINWNDFQSNFIEPVQVFKIFVKACGIQSSYDVLSREPEYVTIQAQLKEEKTYYANDEFSINDLLINLTKENGVIDENIVENIKIYNKSSSSEDLKLLVGLNEIVVEFNQLTTIVYINAEQREVDHIRIKVGSDAKTQYFVGDNVIDTNDIEIYVFYDENEIVEHKVVPLSEGELIFSELIEGQNEILVNYGSYKTDTFTINAVYDVSKYNKSGFISAVAAIDNVSSLNEKYILIVEANKALIELENYRDAEINESIEILNNHISEFNNIAKDVNVDFNKTIEVGNSVIYTILYFSSFSLLGILIALLKKKML